jgi:hypothetical protein
MGRPHEEPPPRREKQPPGPRIESLAELRKGTPWLWAVCTNNRCGRSVPIALTPYIIRLGALYPADDFRRNLRCTSCGHRGAMLTMRSWAGSNAGWSPWPVKHYEVGPDGIAHRRGGSVSL